MKSSPRDSLSGFFWFCTQYLFTCGYALAADSDSNGSLVNVGWGGIVGDVGNAGAFVVLFLLSSSHSFSSSFPSFRWTDANITEPSAPSKVGNARPCYF